jgi:putative glutamine amidotransferase
MMPKRPLIGVTLDAEPAGGWSKLPWYALRRNYFDAVVAAGGLPVALPHRPELAADYLDALDGLLVTGGAFDVDPALWGGGAPHPKVTLKPGRTDFELAAVRAALSRDMPVLGICGGQQLLAVAFGGTLIQHIPDEVEGALAHEQPNPRTEPGHEVAVRGGTLLAAIVGAERLAVNSAHHQAVATPGNGAVVNAVAPDGVIEGVEHPGHRFALGVQWHPEYAVDPRDPAIFDAFVRAARA